MTVHTGGVAGLAQKVRANARLTRCIVATRALALHGLTARFIERFTTYRAVLAIRHFSISVKYSIKLLETIQFS